MVCCYQLSALKCNVCIVDMNYRATCKLWFLAEFVQFYVS